MPPDSAMIDYREGIKRDVAEIKFLIHDLRVEPFINEVLHFHVTLNTDLEIHGVDQAQALHGEDLAALKELAVDLRKAFREYSNAVRNFSPDKTILLTGRKYIDTIFSICELVLNPLWGRSDRVLVFLPPNSRSVQSRNHYRNCIAWIRGVRARIKNFFDEQVGNKDLRKQFDIAAEIEEYSRNVIQGYVAETAHAKVELQVGPLEQAVVFGNLPRFRRMYFNLVMNAVDAMSERRVGVLRISEVVDGDYVVLRVQDDGEGMTPEKVAHLMRDRSTLDGELHSLGFVFVRQTVADFGGELGIESQFGQGTTITIRFPRVLGVVAPPRQPSGFESEIDLPKLPRMDVAPGATATTTRRAPTDEPKVPPTRATPDTTDTPETDAANPEPAAAVDRQKDCGRILLDDLRRSDAQHPGSIFMIAVDATRIDAFTHRPYERLYDIAHEDLSPMLWRTIVRGRVEQDEAKQPILILKPPHDVGEFFDFREVPEEERSMPKHLQMVRDEYVRIARKLIATGLAPETPLLLADGMRFFPGNTALTGSDPVPLRTLAELPLSTEQAG